MERAPPIGCEVFRRFHAQVTEDPRAHAHTQFAGCVAGSVISFSITNRMADEAERG